jgi:hypothetical protein
MEERLRFVIRLKDGESMASLCREFDISRKTGYKILQRQIPVPSTLWRSRRYASSAWLATTRGPLVGAFARPAFLPRES